ncbi:MAG: protein-L-isoaspartate O-methyltransferase family protein [Microthrixaceae bacterium]
MPRDRTLRGMVDALTASRVLRSPSIRAAMLAVDRARFVPHGAADAYRDAPVVLQRGADGLATSTISQPTMVVHMLEELSVEPGHRVLEVGTASGYNAALLAHLVGDEGQVVTVEIDRVLAETAAARLAGLTNVRVVAGDGRAGHLDGAPYDRVIITAGAAEVVEAWREQLSDQGRLVVPLTGRDRIGRCVTYDRSGGELIERASTPCGFVPLR